jgi:hypothetical protein
MTQFPSIQRVALGMGALAALVLPVIAADQPAAQDPPPARTYIGTLRNSHSTARVAIVAEARSYLLYICSQDQPTNKALSQWLTGELGADGSFATTSPDGLKVKGVIKEETAEGTVTDKDGKEMSFGAGLVPADYPAGLYRREFKEGDGECVAGWIIDQDRKVAGSFKNKKTAQVSAADGPLPGKNDPGRKLTDATGKRGSVQCLLKAVDPTNNTITVTVSGQESTLPVDPKPTIVLLMKREMGKVKEVPLPNIAALHQVITRIKVAIDHPGEIEVQSAGAAGGVTVTSVRTTIINP